MVWTGEVVIWFIRMTTDFHQRVIVGGASCSLPCTRFHPTTTKEDTLLRIIPYHKPFVPYSILFFSFAPPIDIKFHPVLHFAITTLLALLGHCLPDNMPRPTTRLSNCYVPQPLPSKEAKLISRTDRPTHSLRQLVIQSSDDSCLVELGHTKVMCRVMAPLYASSPQLPPGVQLNMDQGTLHCEVKYASQIAYPTTTLLATTPSSVDHTQVPTGRINSWIMTRETELASGLLTALSAAVPLEPYPKACVLVQITVLHDDGSVLPASIFASTVALSQANINLLDTITACSVAVVQQDDQTAWWADPTLDEMLHAKAIVTLGILPNSKDVTLWEQSGTTALSPEETNRAMDLCRDGCRTMQRFVREHLIDEFNKEQQ